MRAELAEELAFKYHKEQFDLAKRPYIEHIVTVVKLVKKLVENYSDKEEYIQVAWMHDLVEDTELTLKDLEDMGFKKDVVLAIEEISNKGDRGYNSYIKGIQSDLTRVVKMADLTHNLDIRRLGKERIEELTEGQLRRYNKYIRAREGLKKSDEEIKILEEEYSKIRGV